MSWFRYDKKPKKVIPAGTGIRGGGKYGTTWWGQQWLNAFSAISDANRLPRGRTYANNGSVRSIDIVSNEVKAVVQGSYKYKIGITVPRFSKAERSQLLDIVMGRPDLLSQLLNRTLPQDLLELCEAAGIRVFPKKWRDFSATCSCPDHAQPCKHLAAIIYLLANEIDKNPFKVFELHDFDLVAALEGAGLSVGTEQAAQPTPLADLMAPLPANANTEALPAAGEWSAVNLAAMGECGHVLDALLTPSPLFYQGPDFKALLTKAVARVAKAMAKTSGRIAELSSVPYHLVERVELRLDAQGRFAAALALDADGRDLLGATKVADLAEWLSGVSVGRLGSLAPGLRGLWLAYRYAEALARRQAVLPQLVGLPDGAYRVRWVPATIDESVAKVHAEVAALLPEDLLRYALPKGGTAVPLPADRLAVFTDLCWQYFMAQHVDTPADQHSVGRLFFAGQPVRFDDFANREYPATIQLWLGRLHIAAKSFVPLLEVAEPEEGRFAIHTLVESRAEAATPPIPLREVLRDEAYRDIRMEVLRDISVMAEYLPSLRETLVSQGDRVPTYAAADFAEVLFKQLPVIRLFGIQLLLPRSLSKIIRPAVSLGIGASHPGAVLKGSLIGLRDLLRYDWQVAIGDHFLHPDEFREMLEGMRGLVKIRGEYVYFDEAETRLLAERLAKPPVIDGVVLLQIALSGEYMGAPVKIDGALRERLEQLTELEELPPPPGLQATLRPYQQRGYSWLYKNLQVGFGSILADDMGLGKTLQVIALLLKLKHAGDLSAAKGVLVVAPTTLLTNWARELARFAPAIEAGVYHGPDRDLARHQAQEVVITTYGVARTDLAKLRKRAWLCLVIDEAQHIKNAGTAQSKAIKGIPAQGYIALSGTPVENRLSEYWSIFDFANKGYLGTPAQFKKEYAIPIEADRDQRVLRRFHRVTAPFVMRRLKTDKSVIADLPDKVEVNQYCHLTPEQAVLYEGIVEKNMKDIEANDGKARNGLVLKMIMALKQVCNHPYQYLRKGKRDAQFSGKCPLLLELVEQALDNDEKTIIFTQFKEMGELLAPMLEQAFGDPVPFLHGGTSRQQRDRMVEGFQTHRGQRLMLLSLKAAGTGLNLTAASQVIHFDLWWNPAVEAQATDRAFRIGQQRKVVAHRLITSATFEERIDRMIQEKKALANLTVATGEQWIGDLSNTDLRKLFALGR